MSNQTYRINLELAKAACEAAKRTAIQDAKRGEKKYYVPVGFLPVADFYIKAYDKVFDNSCISEETITTITK